MYKKINLLKRSLKKRETIVSPAFENVDFWKQAGQARVSGALDRVGAHLAANKTSGDTGVERRNARLPAGPGMVHLKGPFISTCVYCPSCVWPRISLLRFVSPLQRSQCIFPRAQAGSHLTFWRSAPQRSTWNKRLCLQTHARALARSQTQRRDTIPLPLWLYGHENASRARMGASKRYERARQKRTAYSLPGPSRKAPQRRKRMFIYMLMESKNDAPLGRTFLDLPGAKPWDSAATPNRENIRVSEKSPDQHFRLNTIINASRHLYLKLEKLCSRNKRSE